jgi:hypothetical protein
MNFSTMFLVANDSIEFCASFCGRFYRIYLILGEYAGYSQINAENLPQNGLANQRSKEPSEHVLTTLVIKNGTSFAQGFFVRFYLRRPIIASLFERGANKISRTITSKSVPFFMTSAVRCDLLQHAATKIRARYNNALFLQRTFSTALSIR